MSWPAFMKSRGRHSIIVFGASDDIPGLLREKAAGSAAAARRVRPPVQFWLLAQLNPPARQRAQIGDARVPVRPAPIT
jgi:hypothetical protein